MSVPVSVSGHHSSKHIFPNFSDLSIIRFKPGPVYVRRNHQDNLGRGHPLLEPNLAPNPDPPVLWISTLLSRTLDHYGFLHSSLLPLNHPFLYLTPIPKPWNMIVGARQCGKNLMHTSAEPYLRHCSLPHSYQVFGCKWYSPSSPRSMDLWRI